jgi:cytochrome c-type biogenesis protein CcmH
VTRLLAALLLLATSAALAIEPGEILSDPAQEARARAIGKELRCLVCQNQSIDDSNADLARDLRKLVRERVAAGDTDAQVTDFVVARYGAFVRLKPPVSIETWALWFGPVILLVLGGAGIALYLRRRRPVSGDVPLDAGERARVDALMDKEP